MTKTYQLFTAVLLLLIYGSLFLSDIYYRLRVALDGGECLTTRYGRFTPPEKTTAVPIEKDNKIFLVCFLLGNSSASEFYMPTFRNTLSVPSS